MIGKLGVVGCGNWGKNLVRNFCQLLGPENVVICDERSEVIRGLALEHQGVGTTTDLESVFTDSSITAVAIATPVPTHYSLARRALSVGKHVFVEKPMTTNTAEAKELCALAKSAKKVLMVDHLLLFHPAVRQISRLVAEDEFGEILHLSSRRTNLGIVRSEENVLWSLGTHDVAVFLDLVGESPVQVAAQGGVYLQPHLGIHDVVFVTMRFPAGQIASLDLSWFHPHKVREITVIGRKRSVVFDDAARSDKLRIHNVGAETSPDNGLVTFRNAGAEVVPIDESEPLSLSCQHFLESFERGHALISTGETGVEVVRVLEAAQESLDQAGQPVALTGQVHNG